MTTFPQSLLHDEWPQTCLASLWLTTNQSTCPIPSCHTSFLSLPLDLSAIPGAFMREAKSLEVSRPLTPLGPLRPLRLVSGAKHRLNKTTLSQGTESFHALTDHMMDAPTSCHRGGVMGVDSKHATQGNTFATSHSCVLSIRPCVNTRQSPAIPSSSPPSFGPSE